MGCMSRFLSSLMRCNCFGRSECGFGMLPRLCELVGAGVAGALGGRAGEGGVTRRGEQCLRQGEVRWRDAYAPHTAVTSSWTPGGNSGQSKEAVNTAFRHSPNSLQSAAISLQSAKTLAAAAAQSLAGCTSGCIA
jgi:hypothetical protein